MKLQNSAAEHLVTQGLLQTKNLKDLGPTRDRQDIRGLQCQTSGVIILNRSDHIEPATYTDDYDPTVGTLVGSQVVPRVRLGDAARRRKLFAGAVNGQKWLDLGAGGGDTVEQLRSFAKSVSVVEPSSKQQEILRSKGLRPYTWIGETQEQFDVITMFHVLEHILKPVEFLERTASKLTAGGQIIIEVPHARDALLTIYDCESFRRFTLWSQHLVLHTAESLSLTLREAGFQDIHVEGFQRYPLANHLYWLRHGQPGGHEQWGSLNSDSLSDAYSSTLLKQDATDTLIAYARRAGSS